MAMTAPMSRFSGSQAGVFVNVAERRRSDAVLGGSGDARSLLVPGLGRAIRVKIASKRDEFEQAFRLVSGRYKERGYETADAGEFRYTPHHALPGTVTFVAMDGDRVVATLSMVPDNDTLGLPLESIYGDEVGDLRRQGRSLAEVTSLAEEGLNPREFLRVFSAMIRLMFQYHVRRGGDTWVITVNPRHSGYYRKVLGFAPLGPCRAYSTVGDHPAEAFYLDVNRMRDVVPEKYEEFFGEALSWQVLTAPVRPADYAHHFGSLATLDDYRAILKVMASGSRPGQAPKRWEWGTGASGTKKATEACGSWHSRRCSPIAADY